MRDMLRLVGGAIIVLMLFGLAINTLIGAFTVGSVDRQEALDAADKASKKQMDEDKN